MGKDIGFYWNCAGDSSADWDMENTDYDFTQIGEKLYVYQKILFTGSYEYKVLFNQKKLVLKNRC